MTREELEQIITPWKILLSKPFSFNDINFDVNYVHYAFYSSTYVHQPHYHPWYEFIFNTRGSMYTSFNNDEFFIEPMTSYLVPPGQIHSHRNNGAQCEGLCFRFSLSPINNPQNFNKINNILSVPRPFTFDSEIEKISLSGSLLGAQAEFTAWLMRLCDSWNNKAAIAGPIPDLVSPQVSLFLEEYYNKKITVNDIAIALNMSYRTLSRKFKSETGITITDKLEEIRLDKARHLLLETNKSILQIAADVGYESEFYFSRVFKKQEHISPSTYRKYFKKENGAK